MKNDCLIVHGQKLYLIAGDGSSLRWFYPTLLFDFGVAGGGSTQYLARID
jgi:hypothetical protein